MARSKLMTDSVSDIMSSYTSLDNTMSRSPAEVRAAQLALTSAALADAVSLNDALLDDALQAEIREVLSAVGIYTKTGRIQTRPSRRMTGLGREANGRKSRRKVNDGPQ